MGKQRIGVVLSHYICRHLRAKIFMYFFLCVMTCKWRPENMLSPSTVWALGVELMLSGLTVRPLSVEPSHCLHRGDTSEHQETRTSSYEFTYITCILFIIICYIIIIIIFPKPVRFGKQGRRLLFQHSAFYFLL